MSAALIKTAVAGLLTANVPALKVVNTQLQRVVPRSRTPRATVWDLGYNEHRLAGGFPGLKELEWRIGTYVWVYGKRPDADGATFDNVMASIEQVYRTNSSLNQAADTSTTLVRFFGEEMTVERQRMQISRQFVLWMGLITAGCREMINV